MKARDRILSRFAGGVPDRPLFLPDLTLWYPWHKRRGSLPAAWGDLTMPQVAGKLGAAAWTVARPWRQDWVGINVITHQTDDERTITYETPGRTLTERWSLGPDGDWWQMEYPVKSLEDLSAARRLVEARTYTLDTSNLQAEEAAVGDAGVLALEIPMRPYSDMLHTLLGWGEGLMLFMAEGQAVCLEMLAILEDKLHALLRQIAELPSDLFLAPDNLDGQYISPRVFRNQLGPSYRLTADLLHRHNKFLVVHVGGPARRLLPLLAEAGVDGVEGIAGPPQSDATLAEARALAGPNLALWGGIPQDFLVDIRTEAEFEDAVTKAAQQALGDGRMILGIADRVSVDSSIERLQQVAGLIERAATGA